MAFAEGFAKGLGDRMCLPLVSRFAKGLAGLATSSWILDSPNER